MLKAVRIAEEGVKHIVLVGLGLLTLLPLLWMLSVSVRSPDEVFSGNLFWVQNWTWDGYWRVLTEIPIFRWTWNSLFIGGLQTLGQLFVGVCAAYAFARYRFPGRDALFLFVLMTMMIPQQVTMIPTYLIINDMNALNTYAGVILPHLASGFAIFMLRQSFLTLPKELNEAASIDGCGPLRTLWHVYVRLSGTVLWTLTIVLFVANFNDYNWPLLVLRDQELMPLPLAFQQFRNESQMEWGPTMSVAALSMIPVLVLFIFAQRRFMDGVTAGSVKG